MKITRLKNQKGSVLLWGMIILLVLTVIGLSAMRMSNTDSKIAGNQMISMLSFEGAESLLRQSASLYAIQQTAATGTAPTNPDPSVVKVRVVSFQDANSGVSVTGTSSMGEEKGCPPLTGIAISTEMTPDTGGIGCRLFTNSVTSTIPGTGAKNQHSEGIIKLVPPTS